MPPDRRLSDTDRWLRGVRVLYRAHVVGGALTHEVDGTTDEARWFPLAEVPALPHVSQVDLALEALRVIVTFDLFSAATDTRTGAGATFAAIAAERGWTHERPDALRRLGPAQQGPPA